MLNTIYLMSVGVIHARTQAVARVEGASVACRQLTIEPTALTSFINGRRLRALSRRRGAA